MNLGKSVLSMSTQPHQRKTTFVAAAEGRRNSSPFFEPPHATGSRPGSVHPANEENQVEPSVESPHKKRKTLPATRTPMTEPQRAVSESGHPVQQTSGPPQVQPPQVQHRQVQARPAQAPRVTPNIVIELSDEVFLPKTGLRGKDDEVPIKIRSDAVENIKKHEEAIRDEPDREAKNCYQRLHSFRCQVEEAERLEDFVDRYEEYGKQTLQTARRRFEKDLKTYDGMFKDIQNPSFKSKFKEHILDIQDRRATAIQTDLAYYNNLMSDLEDASKEYLLGYRMV